MNCKPGELAVIARADGSPHIANFLGRILRVTQSAKNRHGEAVWGYEGAPLRSPGLAHTIECIPDVMLRPIRDPGDDARDQTLDWLPVPTTQRTKETA